MTSKQPLKKKTPVERIPKNNNSYLSCVMVVLNEVKNDSRVKKCAKALQKANFEVKVFGLSSDKKQQGVKRVKIQGIPTLLFPNPRFNILSSAVKIYTWKYITQGLLAAMWKYLDIEQPDVIHTHDFHSLIIGKELLFIKYFITSLNSKNRFSYVLSLNDFTVSFLEIENRFTPIISPVSTFGSIICAVVP